MPVSTIFIGCAGWAIPRTHAVDFPGTASHLERYAHQFPAVEINSSFDRPHKPATYARWAALVPEGFRFAVKVPKVITHTSRLTGTDLLGQFLQGPAALGTKLGPLLVQLPPSLEFDQRIVQKFFLTLRKQYAGSLVCEPRHGRWFTAPANQLLEKYRIARVAADPSIASELKPGGWKGLVYYRLHGSPRRYYSAYSEAFLKRLAETLLRAARTAPAWCIFDNTAAGEATRNALFLWKLLGQSNI